MKHFKRANIYKASNVTFNPETCEAISYDWWTFTKLVNGKLVFNNHGYSNSTRKHQYKVRRLLSELGLEVDLTVDVPGGLQRDTWTEQAVASVQSNIDTLMAQLNNPRRRKSLDAERIQRLNELHKEKQVLTDFIASIN